MNKEQLLKIITAPIMADYFPKKFLNECNNLKDLSYVEPLISKKDSLFWFRQVVPEEWHSWFEIYIQLVTDGKFPSLWPLSQDMAGFDFKYELDDFKKEDEFYSLGTDPGGDWFVMTKNNGSRVYLCDQYVYNLYDGWINPDHLIAWALRFTLAEENQLKKEDIINYWKNQNNKIEQKTIERIASGLS